MSLLGCACRTSTGLTLKAGRRTACKAGGDEVACFGPEIGETISAKQTLYRYVRGL
jgi:hypothetical protein